MNISDYLIEGSVLKNICRVCDLIKLDFSNNEETICLHIQSSLMRGFKKNRLLISSNDMFIPSKYYKRRPFKKFKWDIPGNSLFDDQLEEFKKEIANKKVQSISLCEKDLVILFEEDLKIDVLLISLETEKELFRIFKKGNLDSHLVVET